MNKYFDTLTNVSGDSLPSYRAQVFDSAGSIVTIYKDNGGTRFTDAAGGNVNYATADPAGRVEFYWTAATGQVLQVLDSAGDLVYSIADFANSFVTTQDAVDVVLGVDVADTDMGAYTGSTITADGTVKENIQELETEVETKAATAALAATTGSSLVGYASSGAGADARTVAEKLAEIEISLLDYFDSGDASHVEAFERAFVVLAAAGGGRLKVPKGAYTLASADVGQEGLAVPANVTISGEGVGSTTITVTGTSVCNVFDLNSVSNVTVEKLSCVGNNFGGTYNYGAFLDCTLESGAGAAASNITIRKIHLTNFKAPYWIRVLNSHASHRLSNINIADITGISVSGNAAGPTDIAINSSVISVESSSTGIVQDVSIQRIYVEATYIKSGIIVYRNCQNVRIRQVTVENAGLDAAFGDDKGCYAIQIYDDAGNLKNISVSDFSLSARSCGIYIVSGEDIAVSNGRVFNQTDTTDGNLPKAGVAINGSVRVKVSNVIAENNARDLSINGPTSTMRTDHVIDHFISDGTSAQSLKVRAPANAFAGGLKFTDCRFVGTTRACGFYLSATEYWHDVEIHNSKFISSGTASYGFDGLISGVQAGSGTGWKITNSEFEAGASGEAFRMQDWNGDLMMKNCKFTSPGIALRLINCIGLDLDKLEANSATTTFHFTDGEGVVDRCREVGGGTNYGLGTVVPTHSGHAGDFVQNIGPANPAAGDGVDYTVGWRCFGTTTWRPVIETVNT